jgi:dienelactone hydrolase
LLSPKSTHAAGPLVTNTFTYASSIDPAINNLAGMVIYDSSQTQRMPVVVFAHPYSDNGSDSANNTLPVVWGTASNMLTRFASNGWVVAAFGMRGRGALGTNDDSGREVHDIYDGLRWVQTNAAVRTNLFYTNTFAQMQNNWSALVGFSGGGGNALNFGSKFPGAVNLIVDYFGISDYGYDATYGWHQQTGPHPSLEANIGGTPAGVPNAYRARYSLDSIATTTISNSFLFAFHNQSDTTVRPSHTTNLWLAFSNSGNSRIWYSNSATLYVHQLPSSAPYLPDSFELWSNVVANSASASWHLSPTGNVRVIGYLVTELFSVWLGGGTNHVADLSWDTINGNFTVTPLTGSMSVGIVQSSFAATQTISSVTVINIGSTVKAPSGLYVDAADISNVNVPVAAIDAQLRWTDNANNETAYQVEVSTNGVDFFLKTTLLANATAYDQARVPWTSNRWFRVRAANGTSYSPYSSPIRVVGNMPPANLAGSTSATNRMTITWSAAGGYLDGYTVQMDTNANFGTPGMTEYYAAGSSTTTREITNQFILNMVYYFRVLSHSIGGNSEAMNKPRSYLAVAPNGVPTVPLYVSMHMDDTANEAVILFDDQSLNETAWRLRYTTNGGSTYFAVSAPWDGSTRYTITVSSLTGGMPYVWDLCGTNALGFGATTTWNFTPPVPSSGSHVYYVDKDATGDSTGTSWANAWKGPNSIAWAQLVAGDVVYLSGGNYTNYLVPFTGGSFASPIIVKTSTNSPHNGAVNLYGEIVWRAANVTIDGSRDGAFTMTTPQSITNNIGLHVIGLPTVDPAIYLYHANGAVLQWAEATGAGHPGVGEGDSAGVRYGDFDGPTNSVIAYCWIHDNYGNAILGNVNAGTGIGLGNIAIHHNYIGNYHNNMFGGSGSSDFYSNYSYGWHGPGVAHPDGIEGTIKYNRIWNNTLVNFHPSSGSGLYLSASEADSIQHSLAVVNNLFVMDSGTANNVLVGQSGNPANVTISNVVVAGNVFWGGDNYNQVVIQTGTDNNWIGRSIVVANNIFESGTDAGGTGLFSSGKLRFDYESNFVFDYNLVSGTSKILSYRTNNADASLGLHDFATSELFNAWSTSYKSNNSRVAYFISPTNHNFRIYGVDTNAVDHGTNLSAWATLIPAITNDINGSPRNQNGKWDIGAYENDQSLILHWSFEEYANSAGAYVRDMSGWTNHGHTVTNFTKGSGAFAISPSNYAPRVVAGRVGSYAANFSILGTNEQWLRYSSDLGYQIGNWFAITNRTKLAALTNGTWMCWWYPTNAIEAATLWSAGFFETNQFDITGYGFEGDLSFQVWKSDNSKRLLTVPTEATPAWQHIAFTWSTDPTGGTALLYTNGVLASTNFVAYDSIIFKNLGYYTNSGNIMVGAKNFGVSHDMLSGHPNNGWFGGYLDELKVWNRTLTAVQIQAEYDPSGSASSGSSSGSDPPAPPTTTNGLHRVSSVRLTGVTIGR